MAYDNRPNLNCKQFEQQGTDYLYLQGINCLCSGGTISSDTGYGISGVTVFTTGTVSSAVQIGCGAQATGIATTVVGTSACATGTTSIAIGCNANAYGSGSISLGTLSESNGNNSIAVGCSQAIGNCAIAIGEAVANGSGTLAVGDTVCASAECALVIGSFIDNGNRCSFGLGWYDGAIGLEVPSILFSNTTSYFYGCGDPKIGFGRCNPEARVDIRTATPYDGFRLEDGNEGDGRVLTSNSAGFATWTTIGSISGTENTIPMFSTGGNGLTDSILRQVSTDTIEANIVGSAIIRPKCGLTSYNCLEILGGYSTTYDCYGPLVLNTGNLCLCQPNGVGGYFCMTSNVERGVNVITCETKLSNERTVINIVCGVFDSNLTISHENTCDITARLGVSVAFNLCGYNATAGDLCGGDINIYAGSGNTLYNGTGGSVRIQAGLHSGTANDGNIYLLNRTSGNTYICNLPTKTTETCAIYIDSSGKLSKGTISGGSSITGTPDTLAKFDGSGTGVADSYIKEIVDTICVCATETILGNDRSANSVVLKARDGSGSAVNLVIKTGIDDTSIYNDGYMYLDPGRGEIPHKIYVGSSTYDKSSVGFMPSGTLDDIDMVICSKSTGDVQLLSKGNVQFGTPSKLFNVSGDIISKATISDLHINGYDTNTASLVACSLHLRGGIAYGANARGGDLYLCAGYGQGTGCSCAGRVYINGLLPQTTETNVLYIDSNGAISSGATTTNLSANNGIEINGGVISLGGVLTGDTNITSPTINHSVNFVSGGTINTDSGYCISGLTTMRMSPYVNSSIFLGHWSGPSSFSTGSTTNVGVGYLTLRNNSSGCGNIALGAQALYDNGRGCYNIGVGTSAMGWNTDGCENIGVGHRALQCNYGHYNLSIGSCAMCTGNDGNANIAIGSGSLLNNGTGNCNIAIGIGSLSVNTTGCDNISIGRYAGESVGFSDRLYIGNRSNCVLICGHFAEKELKVCGVLCGTTDICTPTGTIYAVNFVVVSDERLKSNIKPIELSPVDVEYKEFNITSCPEELRYGVIAQELQVNNPELIRTDSNGMMSVSYIDLLVKEVAFLKEKVYELEKMITK